MLSKKLRKLLAALALVVLMFSTLGTDLVFAAEPSVLSIAEVRQLGSALAQNTEGGQVTVRGIVTAVIGKEVYLQDTSAAIMVYSEEIATTAQAGDELQVTGTLKNYYDLLELVNPTSHAVLSSDNQLPSAAVVGAGDLSDANEGALVTLYNVKTGTGNKYHERPMVDGTGEGVVRSALLQDDTHYARITGVVTFNYGAFKVQPRDEQDVIVAEGLSPISLKAARETAEGTEVTVIGIVNCYVKPSRFYIEDGSGGIQVYNGVTEVAVGDLVSISGPTGSYNGEKQLGSSAVKPVVTILSSGNPLPTPKVVTLGELDSWQGRLVELQQVQVSGVPGSSSFNLTKDGTSSLYVYAGDSNYTADAVKEAGWYNVAGIAAYYKTPQLRLRQISDITEADDPNAGAPKPPLVHSLSPANMAALYNRKPLLSATLEQTDNALDLDSLQMTLNGDAVDATVDEQGRVTYQVPAELAYGEHHVVLTVSDTHGNTREVKWYFSIANPDAEYDYYFGVPHAHTSFSDGMLTPAEAYQYAMEQGIDFLIITDHSNWLLEEAAYDQDTKEYTTSTDWEATAQTAAAFNAANAGKFLALRGFEMTANDWGHSNALFSEKFVEAKQTMTGLIDYYNWLLDQEGAIAAFNHPNWPDDSFNDLAYAPDVDRILNLIEVGNGAPPYSYARSESHYFKALDNGWHVGAVNAQDNHNANWGQPDNLTVVLAEDLTVDAFKEALRNRRVYATETRTLELTVKANGFWMGSVLDVKAGDALDFDITAADSEHSIDKLELITNGGNVIATHDVNDLNSVTWNPAIKAGQGANWYVVKVYHTDGSWGYSSPIFTPNGENDVKLSTLEVEPTPAMVGSEATLSATIKNMGIRDAEQLEVSFYHDSVSADNLLGMATVSYLAAGEEAVAELTWTPETEGGQQLVAVLKDIPGVTTVTKVSRSLTVVPANNKRVLIDSGHKNADVPGTMLNIVKLLRRYGYTVDVKSDPLSASLLGEYDVMILNTPDESKPLTTEEQVAIANWVAAGGGLLVSSKSNYGYDSTMLNGLLEQMSSGIRFNNDNIYEPESSSNYSGGMVWSVYLRNMPAAPSGLNADLEAIRYFSGCSLLDEHLQPLVNDPRTGLEILVASNKESYNYNSENGYTYNAIGDLNGEQIPAIAKENIGKGRIVASGRHFYSDFEIVNDVSNTAFTLRLVDYLAGYNRTQSIASVRSKGITGQIYTVRGVVTAPTDNFFDAMYIQDATGGICLYGNQGRQLNVGDEVIATGYLHNFEGELELAFDDFDSQILYVGPSKQAGTMYQRTGNVTDAKYTGQLVQTSGTIVEFNESESYFKLDDGSGAAYIHVDGYLGADMSRFEVGDDVKVTGLVSVGAAGPRIRVRFKEDMDFASTYLVKPGESLLTTGRSMVQAETFFGGRMGATVDQTATGVTIELNENKVELTLGSDTMLVNGQQFELDSAAFSKNGTIYVPLRWVAEQLGADVHWLGSGVPIVVIK